MIGFQISPFSVMTLGYKNPDVFQEVSWKEVAFSLLRVFLPVLPLSGSASPCGGTRISTGSRAPNLCSFGFCWGGWC